MKMFNKLTFCLCAVALMTASTSFADESDDLNLLCSYKSAVTKLPVDTLMIIYGKKDYAHVQSHSLIQTLEKYTLSRNDDVLIVSKTDDGWTDTWSISLQDLKFHTALTVDATNQIITKDIGTCKPVSKINKDLWFVE
tara:strand:- start:805 stop:1218 length:414 start_codon:yes stop_codon:yes gene_type:complete